jgi:3-phenylpropionate/trans-cinnamate dioxygenase ferredoxin subunit
MGEFTELSKIDELKDGAIKEVNAAGHQILSARVGDNYYAVDKLCPHLEGNLSHGRLEGTVVTCPLHGSQFDVSNGQVVRWLRGGLMSKAGKHSSFPKTLRCTM